MSYYFDKGKMIRKVEKWKVCLSFLIMLAFFIYTNFFNKHLGLIGAWEAGKRYHPNPGHISTCPIISIPCFFGFEVLFLLVILGAKKKGDIQTGIVYLIITAIIWSLLDLIP
jgi:hypothetical protein